MYIHSFIWLIISITLGIMLWGVIAHYAERIFGTWFDAYFDNETDTNWED